MNKAQIYHNPSCSKSRQTLDLLRSLNVAFEIIDYLNNPPNQEELTKILELLQCEVVDLIRTKEKLFKKLNLDKKNLPNKQECIRLLVEYPELIERPIVVYKNSAALGRPPENILKLFDGIIH